MKKEDYLLQDKNILNITKDVFLDTFDNTWFANFSDKTIRKFTILPDEEGVGVEDDGLISYEYNDEYFRCDEFKEQHWGKHILFAGCSQTEGVGGNIEDIWTKMMNDKIYDSDGFYTIARSGFGWQKVITNFMVYIKKYGTPDYLFVLLPNVSRYFSWFNDGKHFKYDQRYPEYYMSDLENPSRSHLISPEEYKKDLIDFKVSWNLFEKFCNNLNIKMIWSTWDELDAENIEFMGNWNNFINVTNQKDFLLFIDEYYKTNKIREDDMKRRDHHYGTVYNKYWAKRFYEEADKRWGI